MEIRRIDYYSINQAFSSAFPVGGITVLRLLRMRLYHDDKFNDDYAWILVDAKLLQSNGKSVRYAMEQSLFWTLLLIESEREFALKKDTHTSYIGPSCLVPRMGHCYS